MDNKPRCCKCNKVLEFAEIVTWCKRIYCKDCELDYTIADKAKEEAELG
jgi:hypothetical protein